MATLAPPAQITMPSRATAWDHAAILALGAAGCALSYDALQQMAVAIHVRGFLTYLFPLLIDGFIAYGVRALIILRGAPFRARLYVWTLFGTATAASTWANALHAVRLNQQTASGTLQLSDLTVGILSTLAPLALAGAVHLRILITRETGSEADTALASAVVDEELKPQAPGGRPPDASLDRIVEIGRAAAAQQGRLTRAVVRQAVTDEGLKLGGERLTDARNILRPEFKTDANLG
ncbi:DUF2637 domain-containing protein [Streptomyces tanashiensis]|uniref:DUF2637 domain-containing protein n=1 Tax=Streptomyces tanashiensis TaxID=67367 RepID=UPI00167E836F|nr:DUF2637 domain-containing protein [Streptomyces tanashiensis]GGY03844.1 hypothetical protein GCM10010299_03460 [Streptomyces tanashiensis]